VKKRTSNPESGEAPASVGDPFPGDRQFVVALHRGLEILRCFKPSDTALGNQELAQRTGLPRATVSRLTYTLSKVGYLVYLEDSGKYRMGIPVLGLGFACLSGVKIPETAQPYMQKLAEEAGNGALIALGGRDRFSMTYLACARSSGMVSLQLNVGSRISLARSGMGRAYIAGLPKDDRADLMEAIKERSEPKQWPALRDGIEDAIDQVQSRGFYLNLGEWQKEVYSVGVPLKPLQNHMPLMAFNCGGPSYLLPKERLEEELGPKLVMLSETVAAAGQRL